MTTFGVGSTVWVFNPNYREYRQDANGRSMGGPIYRAHFRPSEVVSETPRSWVLFSGLKVPKRGGDVREASGGSYGKVRVYMTAEAVDDDVFRNDHAWSIGDAVKRCDVETLRKVAALIGYEVSP